MREIGRVFGGIAKGCDGMGNGRLLRPRGDGPSGQRQYCEPGRDPLPRLPCLPHGHFGPRALASCHPDTPHGSAAVPPLLPDKLERAPAPHKVRLRETAAKGAFRLSFGQNGTAAPTPRRTRPLAPLAKKKGRLLSEAASYLRSLADYWTVAR